ncbi:MAG: hypothetical protein ABIO43_02805 [Sphingomicrobium sp.]
MGEPQSQSEDRERSRTAMQRAYDAEYFARSNGLTSSQARLMLGRIRRQRESPQPTAEITEASAFHF